MYLACPHGDLLGVRLLVPQLFAKRNATGTRLHVHTRNGGLGTCLYMYSAAAVDLR